MRRLLLIILTILTISSVSCSGAQGQAESTDPAETTADNAAANELVIAADGVSDFYVIRSDYAKDVEVKLAVQLRREIIDATGAEPGISTDWEKNEVFPHEIIIGKTLRETDGYIDRIALGETGYVIKEDNGKIFISGGSDEGTTLAVERFIKEFIKGSQVKIPVGTEIIEYHQYEIPELYIAMNRVDTSYRVVIPENADKNLTAAGEALRQIIYEKSGLWLEIEAGKSDAKKAFIISADKPDIDGMHEIYVSGDSLIIRSSSKRGVIPCVEIFVNKYMKDVFGAYNFPKDFRYFDLGDYIIVTYPDTKED